MTKPEPKKKPTAKRVSIEIPKDLEAVYANVAFISHTPAEIVIDFAQVLPRMTKGTVVSRIIMSPLHTKMLHQALAQNIATYEKQFGEIRIPQQTSLADQLFKFPPSDPPDSQEPDSDGDPEKE